MQELADELAYFLELSFLTTSESDKIFNLSRTVNCTTAMFIIHSSSIFRNINIKNLIFFLKFCVE